MVGFFGKILGLLAVSALVGSMISSAQASSGTPGSQEFGYGSVLYINRPETLPPALDLAAELKPDWVIVPLSWSALFPSPDQAETAALDQVARFASLHQIRLVFSIASAPDWAMTPQGPDPAQAAQLVAFLAGRYAGALQAVELFPRANTRSGWGAPASPASYMAVYTAARQALQSRNSPVILVAAGLQPLSKKLAKGDMDDLQFLQGMYRAGALTQVQVISIQYAELTGEPLDPPSTDEPRVLRHYEQVRHVMSDHGHSAARIWITCLNLPTGAIDPADEIYRDAEQQAEWLKMAAVQIRAQLYISAAFMQSFNPGPEPGLVSILQADGTTHPVYDFLKRMFAGEQSGFVISPGRPKDGTLTKDRQER